MPRVCLAIGTTQILGVKHFVYILLLLHGLGALRPTVVRRGQSLAKRFRSLNRQERVERVAAP